MSAERGLLLLAGTWVFESAERYPVLLAGTWVLESAERYLVPLAGTWVFVFAENASVGYIRSPAFLLCRHPGLWVALQYGNTETEHQW